MVQTEDNLHTDDLPLILKGWGLIDGKLIAIDGTKIKAYLMAMEKEDGSKENFKEKLPAYQDLKEQYLIQKQELKNEGLEQKSLTDTDSRRMKNNGSLDICYNVPLQYLGRKQTP